MRMSGIHSRHRETAVTKTFRVFVAVPIPDALTLFLQQVQARLQARALNVRWVKAKNIHLTLKFLGDIDPARVPEVAVQMDNAACMTPVFTLVARGAGVFPNLRRARVLWVGLAGDLDRLKATQSTLESGLEMVGFKKDSRDFGAHLTIGRTRGRIDAKSIGAALELLKDMDSQPFRVDRLILYRSKLKPSGAEYTPLHASHLANTDALPMRPKDIDPTG
jgi:2'-5' RNA ligase